MGGLRLGSVLGFEIRVDYSWFVIVFLILWSFSFGVFPQTLPGYERSVYLAMGAVGAVLFFASLLAHELSHSVVARAKGIPVEGITLFIFGGMARTRMEAETPGDELAIAGVGPLASLVIAGLFTVMWWVGVRTGTAAAPVAEVARYLAVVNVVLAVFNLLPGFPLDGGRLFRALVWKVTGDLTRATRWASWGGQALGFALMALGALQAMSGMVLGGMWLVFIGWFLRTAAAFSFRQHVVREMLTGVRARDLMTPSPHSVSSDLTIDELVERHILLQRHYGFPVLDEDRLVGLVTLEDVKRTPRAEWGGKRVRDIMGTDGALIVSPDAPVTEVLERLQGAGAGHLVVARGGHVEGIVASSDVARWIQREQELGSLVATR
jgi:Zn-dependent protease